MMTTEDLQLRLEELLARHALPGAVAGIWQNGRYVEAAAGIRNLNTGDPMTPDTAFITGSVTKIWTTTLVMTLVDEGVIDVDRPIVEYAPDVRFGADREAAEAMTMRRLLDHSSGLDTGDLFVAAREYPEGVEDYLPAMAAAQSFTAPGRWASYNNVGWIAIELVLRRVLGRTYHDLLHERVIAPLGLHRTVTSLREAALHRMTVGSFPAGPDSHDATPLLMYPTSWSPAGTTLTTTVAETVTFLRTHLDGGQVPGGVRLLSCKAAAAMQEPSSVDPTGPTHGHALGWRYAREEGRPITFTHGGSSIGGRTYAVVSPADNLVLAAHVNSSVGDLLLSDLATGLVSAGSPPFPELGTTPDPTVDPAIFCGTYRRRAAHTEIRLVDGHLHLTATPIAEDRVGTVTPATSAPTSVDCVVTSPTTICTAPTGPRQRPAEISFHDRSDDGFDLLFSGRRLSKRVN